MADAHHLSKVNHIPLKLALPPNPSRLAPALLTGCDLVPVGDGSYRAVPRRIKDMLTVKEAVQLTRFSRDTIYRLYRTGFITGQRLSPRKILLQAESLQAHLEAIREPDFWTSERRAQYWGA